MPSDDRTALVTGAARGIGLAIARRLAGNGVRVALLDLDRERVDAAARDVGAGALALAMGRVGRPEEVAALVAWLASEECSFSTGAVYDLSGGRATYY